MRDRCRTTSARGRDWAGRGIQVCARWNDYANFLADMGEAPPGMSLDRENNDGDYEPGNCRWATPKQQARNRRSNKFVTVRGERMPVAEAAERFGADSKWLYSQLARGRDAETALVEAGWLLNLPTPG